MITFSKNAPSFPFVGQSHSEYPWNIGEPYKEGAGSSFLGEVGGV